MHIIHYVPRKTTPYILYTTSRELPKYIALPRAVYEDQRQRLTSRIEAMKAFAFSTDECRVNVMLRYFGEKPTANCGKCDVCRSRKQIKTLDNKKQLLRDSVIYLASQPGGHTIKYIATETSTAEDTIIDIVRELLDERLISIDNGNITKI
jgi:ATP-dependent DNA helicase RecQ